MAPRWIVAGASFLFFLPPVAATGAPVARGWGVPSGASSMSASIPTTPAELQAEVTELQNEVAALQTQLASLQTTVSSLTAGQAPSAASSPPPSPPTTSNNPHCPHFNDPTITYCGCLPC